MQLSEEFLRNQLITEKISIKQLAQNLGIDRHIITFAIKKYKLSPELKIARANKRSLVGKVYGKLTVKKFSGTDSWNKSEWECECICGNIVIVGISSLNQKYSRSCGCLKKSLNHSRMWRGCGELSMDSFSNIRRGAESRNLEFKITIEFLWELFLKQNRKCALTGIELSLHKHKRNGIRQTASLDRKDSSKGYVENNVQWVHKHVNICKHTYGNEEFIEICNKVAKLHPR